MFPIPPPPQRLLRYEGIRTASLQKESEEMGRLRGVAALVAAVAALAMRLFYKSLFLSWITFISIACIGFALAEAFASHEYRTIDHELGQPGFQDFLQHCGEAATIDNIRTLFQRYNNQLAGVA